MIRNIILETLYFFNTQFTVDFKYLDILYLLSVDVGHISANVGYSFTIN